MNKSKARRWKAWAVTNRAFRFLFDEYDRAHIYSAKPDPLEFVDDARIFRVEIRELPRRKKVAK